MSDVDIQDMSLEQTRAAAKKLLDSTTGDLAGADAERFQALTRRAEQIREQEREKTTASCDLLEALASGRASLEGEGRSLPGYGRLTGTDNTDRPPVVQQRDGALRVLDRHVKADRLPARAAETVEGLMLSGSAPAQSWTQRFVTAAGSEHYET